MMVDSEMNANLQIVRVFYPKVNRCEAALFDMTRSRIIGFDYSRPYHPAGGHDALKNIIIDQGGLVPGSTIYGFACWLRDDDRYQLGSMPYEKH
jgi:hypothetical protein